MHSHLAKKNKPLGDQKTKPNNNKKAVSEFLFSFTHVTIKTNYLYYVLLTPDLPMLQNKGLAQFISI